MTQQQQNSDDKQHDLHRRQVNLIFSIHAKVRPDYF